MNLTVQDYILGFATVVTILSAIREIRKGPSESEQRVTGSAVNLIDRLNTRLEYVEKELKVLQVEIDGLQNENTRLRNGISILINQLRQKGIRPQWSLNEDDEVNKGNKW